MFKVLKDLLVVRVFVWELVGGLFNGICPAAVICWVSGSVIVNLTKGDRVLRVSPTIVPKKIISIISFL